MKKVLCVFIMTLLCVAVYAEEVEVVEQTTESEKSVWSSSLTIDARSSPVAITGGKELSRTVSTTVSGALSAEVLGFGYSFEVEVGESYTDTVYAEATAEPGTRVVLKFGSTRLTVTHKHITYKRRADGTIYTTTTSGSISGTTGSITAGF